LREVSYPARAVVLTVDLPSRWAFCCVLLGACGDDAPAQTGGGTSEAGSSTTGAASTTSGSDTAGSETAGSSGEPWVPPAGFEPYPCLAEVPDTAQRLCPDAADPEGAADEVFIECALEGSCSPGPVPAPVDALLVMAYNIERGLQLDAQLAAFADGTLPMPDVLLMSEADRGCARTSERNVAWEYAEALGMHHVFGVEFVELPRDNGDITAPCEHGNAVLSRYPIGNVRLVRHETNLSWYDHPDEPRLGGRVAVLADIAVGDRIVHVQSLHFESGVNDGPIRAAQAAELAALGLDQPHPVVIGGDTNAGGYVFDLANGTMNEVTVNAFFDAGYVDTHATLPADMRATHDPGLILDIMFVRDQRVTEPAICPTAQCSALSDHLPIWARISL
jgi:endonuclease/exonuclease/phosphatase family metal-dependent hydrolase